MIAIYCAFNLSLGLLKAEWLNLKRVKIIPAIVDVVLITLIINNSAGPGNSWFLLYIFPIISVSRYLGSSGTISLTIFSIAAYLLAYLAPLSNQDVNFYAFALRCMVLVGVGVVAANLAKARQRELTKLIQVVEKVDDAILTDNMLERTLKLILEKGLEFTNSEMGHIRLRDDNTQEYKLATTIGLPQGYEWGTRPLDDGYSRIAIKHKESVIIPQITKAHLKKYLGTYFRLHRPRPKSALFVPLTLRGQVIGVIAVYSRWSRHYTEMDAERLKTLIPLIEMAIKIVTARDRQAKAEKYYQNLIVNSPDPIIVLDKNGQIKVFNKACEELWGVKYEDVKGKPVQNYYVSEEHAKKIGKQLWESKDHRVKNIEALVKHVVNEEIIPISLSACFVKDEQGQLDGSIGVFKDRREAIKMEEKILQAERLAVVGRFARTIGHDIKHRLATARNYATVLLRQCDKDKEPKQYKAYSSIYNSVQSAIDEFKKLLMANTPKSPHKVDLRLSDIFHEIDELMHPLAPGTDIKAVVTYPQEEQQLSGDLGQLVQVFSNLLTNSIHAIEKRRATGKMSEIGLISVSAAVNHHQVQLLWNDNGCGIPEEDRQKIFNAFFTKDDNLGTGLGLHIVKTIIENHNGHITVESVPGRGALFQITLPLLNAEHQDDHDYSDP